MTYTERRKMLGVCGFTLGITVACAASDPTAESHALGGSSATSSSGASSSSGGLSAGGSGATGGAPGIGGAPGNGGVVGMGGVPAAGGSLATGGVEATGGALGIGGAPGNGGVVGMGGVPAAGGSLGDGGTLATGGILGNGGSPGVGGATEAGGSFGTGGTSDVDPSAPLTPIAFFPSKGRTSTCADPSVSIQFNRAPVIQSGGTIRIHEASGEVFDSVTSHLQDGLYFSDLAPRSSGGRTFSSEVLDVVYNTVVFHPKSPLDYGKTYYVTIDEGLITDSSGTSFSVQQSDNWSFTVREQAPTVSDTYTLAADGGGDYCSVEGVLKALPDDASTPRLITVKSGVYPGIIRMSDSRVHFLGEGMERSIFCHKNSATMNDDREGIELSGTDVTFENLTIFNTYLKDGSGQQAEALYVTSDSERVLLRNVHLRSHQDTLRVDSPSVCMQGGKISGSTDPLWGTGAFFCDGCELSSRTSGHAFVVARSTKGFALVNCRVTKDTDAVASTYLAQYHDGREPGRIAYVNCEIDDHIQGWKRPDGNEWYEYNNTDLRTGTPVEFNGTRLTADSPELVALSSAQNWLGWSP